MTTWDILIPHMPHRHDRLVELLDVLEPQIQPGVQVLIYSDNLEASYPFEGEVHVPSRERRLGRPELCRADHGSVRG